MARLTAAEQVALLTEGQCVPVRVHALRRSADVAPLPPPRLRFDRVVLRVCRDLAAAAPELLPAGSLAFITLQAPIRVSAKTVAWITNELHRLAARPPSGRVRGAKVLGNLLRIGTLPAPRAAAARLLCLVHTDATDAARLLAMTRDLLKLASGASSRATGRLVIVTPERSALLATYRHLHTALGIELPYREVMLVFGDGKVARLDD